MKKAIVFDRYMKLVFCMIGLVSIACVGIITLYLLISGIPGILKVGFIHFFFNDSWQPTASSPSYGILPFLLTSIYGACGAIVIGVPFGVIVAVYLSKYAKGMVRFVLETCIQILASIPSVVYGLVGMLVLVPFIAKIFHLSDGSSLFASIAVLTIMILPSIIKVSLTSLDAVNPDYELASYALGATKIETAFYISLKASYRGVITSVILGVGRAIGEAMAVMMVSGNASNMPKLFESVRFLTTAIASEMSYASGLQRQALFSIAFVLYVFILLLNQVLEMIMNFEVKS